MIDPDVKKRVDERYSRSLIIYSSMAASALGIAAIGWIVIPAVQIPASAPAVMPIWVLVFFLAIAAIIARRSLVRWERLQDITLLRGVDGLLATLQTNSIILAALGEMIIIAGVVSAYLSFDRGDLLRSTIIAAVVFVLNFPRRSTWDTIISSLSKV